MKFEPVRYNGRTYGSVAAAYGAYEFGKYLADNRKIGEYTDFAMRLLDPESYTQTLTKKKEEEEEMNSNLPSSVQIAKQKFRANPPLKRVAPGNIEYRDYFNYELSFAGLSKANYALCFVGTKSQYIDDSVQDNMAGFSNKKWFDLDPGQGQNAGTFVDANVNPAEQWIGCSVADVKMDFVNLSTLPCEATVTWYKCLRSASETPLEIYNESEESNKVYSTDFTTNPAIIEEPLTGGNEISLSWNSPTASAPESLVTMPYINLGSRKNVKTQWQRLSSKKTILSGGATWRLSNSGYVNCFQKKSVISDTVEPAYPKGCVVAIVSFQGFGSHVVVPLAGAQPATNEPTLAPGRVGVVISRHLYLKALKPSVNKYDLTYVGVGTVAVRGTPAQMSIIEPDLTVALGEETL